MVSSWRPPLCKHAIGSEKSFSIRLVFSVDRIMSWSVSLLIGILKCWQLCIYMMLLHIQKWNWRAAEIVQICIQNKFQAYFSEIEHLKIVHVTQLKGELQPSSHPWHPLWIQHCDVHTMPINQTQSDTIEDDKLLATVWGLKATWNMQRSLSQLARPPSLIH